MNERILSLITSKLGLQLFQVKNTITLFAEGATIPFISRYRKELTGSLDEVQIASIQKEYIYYTELEKRKETILKTIDEQGLLTAELRKTIEDTFDSIALEDIYLPFKPKRKTKASIARDKGLEPLAKLMIGQFEWDIEKKAKGFITDEVKTVEEALSGARDIVAEWISENSRVRDTVRYFFRRDAIIISKVAKDKEANGSKYQDYFDWSEPLKKCPSHRLLAMRRGENEGILKVKISIDDSVTIEKIEQILFRGNTSCRTHVGMAIKDSFNRLILPSIELEFAQISKDKADDEAIKVFSENLRQLLLAPPLGQKRVMAIDPGFKSGCKIVCLDAQGLLLHNDVVYPHPPQREVRETAEKIEHLVKKYSIEAVAIGSGTAGRETEQFIKYLRFETPIQIYLISEDGASVYSASKIGRDEFPTFDVTVRGAISIGRRLTDPLAELVKIDPKSMGIGQYQHDVDQKKLQQNLDIVVESCVNLVGVNVNTASSHLLTYISGLGPQLSTNIVEYRKENGPFKSRKELNKVARMGAKAFEQSAGFLRISNAENPLDNSAVHPESYYIVEKMAKDIGCKVNNLIENDELRKQIDLQKYVSEKTGIPTLTDIIKELAKPGRDPREKISVFEFSSEFSTIEQLKVGMIVPGLITNVTRFGAFVDIGIKENGLIHVSEIADKYIDDPSKVVKLQQHVLVKVLEVDLVRKRIQLSMKKANN